MSTQVLIELEGEARLDVEAFGLSRREYAYVDSMSRSTGTRSFLEFSVHEEQNPKPWFAPEDGIESLTGVLENLETHPDQETWPQAWRDGFRTAVAALLALLQRARSEQRRFRLIINN